jgi:hypothetical protein
MEPVAILTINIRPVYKGRRGSGSNPLDIFKVKTN